MSDSEEEAKPQAQPVALNPADYEDFDNDPELKKMEDDLKKKIQDIENSENPHLFTFEDGETVDFSKPPDTSFADGLEADAEGYKPITWTQLKKKFCYERPAHGFKLCGDVSQRLQEHWERSKQIKIRDCDGVEGAVFFYCEESEPYFDFDEVQVGNNITVKSPRYHRFMDKQEGMRVEEAKQICKIEKRKFTDRSRLEYGLLNKDHGNKRFKDAKYEEAMDFYDTAIRHMRGSFKENPEDEPRAKELVAQCYLNIAACNMALKHYSYVESNCQSALKINANSACNAKAYFRMGQAALELLELTQARLHLERAIQLAPGDSAITAALDKLNSIVTSQRESDKKLFKVENTSPFGVRKWRLSEVPDRLKGSPNFRDITAVIGRTAVPGIVLQKHMLYRSSNFSAMLPEDLALLKEDLGIKTIIDLRTSAERSTAKKAGAKQQPSRTDAATLFLPVVVKCPAKGGTPKLKYPRGTTAADVQAGRVTYYIDLGRRAVLSMLPYYVFALVLFVGWIPFLWSWLGRLVFRLSIVEAKPLGTYLQIAEKGKSEIREVFRILSERENYPVIITCTSGKDRTGVVCMLLESALGVSDALVANDFAETTKHFSEEEKQMQRERYGLGEEWNAALPETALDFLRGIRAKHGSVRQYLHAAGVTQAQLDRIKVCLAKPPAAEQNATAAEASTDKPSPASDVPAS